MTTDIQNTVKRVLNGDIQAFSTVVLTYQAEIWQIICYSLEDRTTAEDLVQQVFINAYKNLKTYDPDKEFGVWLRSIARNLLRNQIRKSVREKKHLASYNLHLTSKLDKQEFPDAQSREIIDKLEKCIEKLSPNTVKSLKMRYEQAQGFSAIAEALGRTLAATRQLLTRARIAIRRCLGERRAAE